MPTLALQMKANLNCELTNEKHKNKEKQNTKEITERTLFTDCAKKKPGHAQLTLLGTCMPGTQILAVLQMYGKHLSHGYC